MIYYLGMVFNVNVEGKVRDSINKYIDELLAEYKAVTGITKTSAGEDLFTESCVEELTFDMDISIKK